MPDKIELHGWTDLIIPTEVLFDVSSRAYKLYSYMVFRARDSSSAFPGQERISNELETGNEKWSLPTVKRTFTELVSRFWVYRQRRANTSSITHVFRSKSDCQEFAKLIQDSSPVIRPDSSPVIRKRVPSSKENSELPVGEASKIRQRDLLFDAIAERLFGLRPDMVAKTKHAGTRIGMAKSAIVDAHRALVGDDASVPTPAMVSLFCQRYRAAHDSDLPRDKVKIAEYWLELMAGPGDGGSSEVDPLIEIR